MFDYYKESQWFDEKHWNDYDWKAKAETSLRGAWANWVVAKRISR